MPHRRSTVKGSLSFANPTVRAWLFQILAVVAVVGIVGWLFQNTVTNLNNRGITSGFAFLDRGAGFGIVQHLIDYNKLTYKLFEGHAWLVKAEKVRSGYRILRGLTHPFDIRFPALPFGLVL